VLAVGFLGFGVGLLTFLLDPATTFDGSFAGSSAGFFAASSAGSFTASSAGWFTGSCVLVGGGLVVPMFFKWSEELELDWKVFFFFT